MKCLLNDKLRNIFLLRETNVSTEIFKENCSMLITFKENVTGNLRTVGTIQQRRMIIFVCKNYICEPQMRARSQDQLHPCGKSIFQELFFFKQFLLRFHGSLFK